ncbi:hypothetical protein ACWDKQ_20140 [Saccharopolyspora sp. NPDC000995]
MRYRQLFLAGMTKRYGEKGRPRKLQPRPTVRPFSTGVQLSLLTTDELTRAYDAAQFDLRSAVAPRIRAELFSRR